MFSLIAWLIFHAAVGLSTPPVKNAWLEVTPLASQDAPVTIELKAPAGPVRLPALKAGLALVCVGGEEVAVSCAQQYLEAGAAVEPVLQRGVRVTARVRAGKDAVAGARLALVPKELRSRRFVTLPLGRDKGTGRLIREVMTDTAGRVKTPQLAPGEYLLEVKAPGGQILHQEVSVPRPEALLPKGTQAAGAEVVLDIGEIALDAGIAVAVFVTGPGGEPVSGAKVGGHQGDRPETTRFFETTADGQGKAEISGLAPTVPVNVVCLAPGFLRFQQHFDVPPPAVGCSLEPLARIEGVVLGSDRRPVAGATVSSRAIERLATTDSDGRFLFVDLAAGTYALTAVARRYGPERIVVTLAAGERRELPPIELTLGRKLRGVVKDGGSGEPVAGARIVSIDPLGAVDEVSGEDGEVSFAAGDDPLHLRASAEGYPDAEVAIDPGKLDERTLDGDKPVAIELQRGGRLHIEVWDEEADQPCAGCAVNLQGFRSGRSTQVVMDGGGECLTEPLTPGPYAVSVVKERSLGGVVQVSNGAESRQVGVVAGSVTPVQLGEKARVVEVRFRPPVPQGWTLSASSPSGSRNAEPLGDGSFSVRRRPGSAVVLQLFGGGNVTVRQSVLPADDDRPLIDLPLPGSGIHGTLVAGKPTTGGRVLTVVSAGDGTVQASALIASEGGFAVPFLTAGLYTLLVDGRPIRSFTLAPGQEEDLGSLALDAP
ncbi:MAG TPA: carboxypeptidase regulatory-like domain-containing protein [Thermoanaerobaculia bacterium]|nr:carboxypeptidase regulatory-like domain-containing protein [Thermoanaerobaculia bacterium]